MTRRALLGWVAGFVVGALGLGGEFALLPSSAGEAKPLGRVHFPVSCSREIERSFEAATALLHGFQFADAERTYAAITKSEPNCAMAYWGIAMSRLKYPALSPPVADDLKVARQALRTAASQPTASPRERAYLAALGLLFPEDDSVRWRDRVAAYEQAMGSLADQYPDDREATVFYALALNMAGLVADNNFGKRTRAAELLLVALSELPDHPGRDHYLTYCLNYSSTTHYDPSASQRASMISGTRGLVFAGFASLTLFCGLGLLVNVANPPLAIGATQSSLPIGGPFALTAHDGRAVTDQTFRGKWLLVYFGYTHCPDVCPTTLADIAELLEQLGPLAEKVQPLFITIDPERDATATVAEFVGAFDRRIIGLTGTPAEIAAAAKQYRVYYKKLPAEAASDNYLMEHSSFIYVMNPDGKYVTLFSPQQGQKPDQMASQLRQLITEPHVGG